MALYKFCIIITIIIIFNPFHLNGKKFGAQNCSLDLMQRHKILFLSKLKISYTRILEVAWLVDP